MFTKVLCLRTNSHELSYCQQDGLATEGAQSLFWIVALVNRTVEEAVSGVSPSRSGHSRPSSLAMVRAVSRKPSATVSTSSGPTKVQRQGHGPTLNPPKSCFGSSPVPPQRLQPGVGS